MDTAPTPVAVTPPSASVNRITSRAAWQAARDACRADPGRFHGDIASQRNPLVRTCRWVRAERWIRRDDDGCWRGFDAVTGAPGGARDCQRATGLGQSPWMTPMRRSIRWFSGALTNACFNEVDRHVLAGHGERGGACGSRATAGTSRRTAGAAPRWFPTASSRKRLLLEVARCALALRGLGLAAGDRIADQHAEHPRAGVLDGGLQAARYRLHAGVRRLQRQDAVRPHPQRRRRIVITADGGYRNAQIVAFKEAYTDPALDGYVPAETAIAAVTQALDSLRTRVRALAGDPRGRASGRRQ
jgi:acrylyl-CoA reductase (NADPH)/3-hydroxypropionyl-CoA dehydratase/3-hydroxypropionyl-CoA synthetase